MIIILFFLAQTPVEADTVETAVGATDSLKNDSLALDTLPKYKIPEVVEITEPVAWGSFAEYAVSDDDLFLSDAFAVSPFLVKGGLLYHQGNEPYRIPVTLNSHPLTNQLTGYFNIDRVAAQFVERITVNGDNVDLHTLINRYNRPYSHIRFMVLGKTTFYNINFTRPITNDMGFYTAGTYCRTRVAVDTGFAYETANSLYANYYWNNFFKSRVDFVYNGSVVGEKKKTELIDASLVLGRGVVVTNLFFNFDRNDYDSSTIRTADAVFGAAVSGLHDLHFTQLGWHCTIKGDNARILLLPSSPRTEQFEYFIRGGVTAAKEWGRFQGSLTADLDFIGREGFFPAPDLKISYNPFDSLFLYAGLGRSYRLPSLSELDSNAYVFDPDFPHVGNPELVPEFSWRQEVGCRYRNLFLTFYQIDYRNYILNRWYTFGQYFHPINISQTDFLGVEAGLDLPLAWGFRFGFGGDYLINYEPEQWYPKYSMASGLGWQAERGRARFRIFGQGRYLGPLISGWDADHRPLFTLGALVRFVTLTACLKVDNLLDDEFPDFPVPERDISLSIKWEFFD